MQFTNPLNFQNFRLVIEDRELKLSEILSSKQALDLTDSLESSETIAFIEQWFSTTDCIDQHSSGSTGKPKKIRLLKDHMYESAVATIKKLELEKGSNALLSINPQYIGGKMMILRAIINEMNLYIGKVNARPLKEIKPGNKIDFYSFVPYQLQESLKYDQEKVQLLNKAKAIILGGAAVGHDLHKLVKENISAPCYSTYGMTETVSHVALKLLNTSNEQAYFEAIEGISFSRDPENCLIIHAEQITGKQSLKTNDIVNLISPNRFEWLGRKDFVINSAGLKLHPEQLETELAEIFKKHQIPNRFLFFGKKDQKWGEKLCLLIEKDQEVEGIAQILGQIKSKHRPKEVYYLDNFILTESGKLNRKASIEAIS